MNYPYTNYGQQQYGYQPQYQMPQAQQAVSYTCLPVTSREEGLGTPTDFSSAGTIMPDLAHDMIYMKRFNPNTGVSEFMEFYRKPPEQPQKPPEYATVQMLNDALEEIRGDIAALNKPAKKKGGADE